MFCTSKDDELVVIGGKYDNRYFSLVTRIKTNQSHTRVPFLLPNCKLEIKLGYSAVQIKPGIIVALVEDEWTNRQLISFNFETKQLSCIVE